MQNKMTTKTIKGIGVFGFFVFSLVLNVILTSRASIACSCYCWNSNSRGPYEISFGSYNTALGCKIACENSNYGFSRCN